MVEVDFRKEAFKEDVKNCNRLVSLFKEVRLICSERNRCFKVFVSPRNSLKNWTKSSYLVPRLENRLDDIVGSSEHNLLLR